MYTTLVSSQRSFGFLTCISLSMLPVFLMSTFCYSQIRLVKDINAQVAGGALLESELASLNLTSAGNYVYYIAQGKELWRTNTSGYTAVLVKSFDGIQNLINVNGTLFFIATTADTGQELWKSNGSASSTVLVKDIRPGADGSSLSSLTVVGSLLYFVADDGTTGREVWKSDGTRSGTSRVKDILQTAGSSNPTNLVASGGSLFFVANDGKSGYEIWKSDGTSTGAQIVKDLRTGYKVGSNPQQLTDVNGVLFFTALKENGERRLFKSNGTTSGTQLVSDALYNLKSLINVDGTLFFAGTDPAHGHELWKSDGTSSGTVMVKDITPRPSGEAKYGFLHISNFTTDGKKLYFLGDGPVGQWLWVSDGSTEGTIPLAGPYDVYFTFINPQITPFAGEVYFNGQAGDSENISLLRTDGSAEGEEIFVSDFDDVWSNETKRIVADNFMYFERLGNVWKTDGVNIYPIRSPYTFTGASDPVEITDVRSIVYFGAFNGKTNGLWKSDGTKSGTRSVKYFDAPIRQLCVSGNYLYFIAKGLPSSTPPTTWYKLWRTDVTTGQTRALTDFNAQADDQITEMVDLGGTLVFSVVTSDGHPQLWKSNGATENTVLIKTFNNIAIPITHLKVLGASVVFSTSDDNGATDALWKSDGTAASTMKLKTLKKDAAAQRSITESLAVNGKVFFIAFNGYDYEVWRTDGTVVNTFRINIYQDDANVPDVNDLTDINGTVYFGAKGNTNSCGRYDRELWKTDGTVAGTVKVVTFPESTDANYFVYSRTADDIFVVGGVNKNILVVLSDIYQEGELWRTDGTPSGMQMLTPLNGGRVISPEVVYIDDLLYFRATYARLWRSDGTECGTFNVIRESATDLTLSQGLIFMSMYQRQIGQELFLLDPALVHAPGCNSDISIASTTGTVDDKDEDQAIIYPNPFLYDFVLRVNGPESGCFNAAITDLKGVQQETATNLNFNTEYPLGESLAPGIYILMIDKPRKVSMKVTKSH